MSLLEELQEYFKKNRAPWDATYDVDCVLLDDEVLDTDGRWYNTRQAVYQRKTIVNRDPLGFDDEFVMVVYSEPATEEQDWEDALPPDVYAVWPEEVTVTKFRRLDES